MQSRPLSIRLLGHARSSAHAVIGYSRPFDAYDLILLLVVMVFAVGTRLPTMNRPFERDPEGCGAFYGIVARNYFRWGVASHYFIPIQNAGHGKNTSPVYYPNHPPLLPLVIATTYLLGGFNPHDGSLPPDWQTRLSTVLSTLGCVVTIYSLLRWRAGPRAAAVAAFLFAAMPITLMFGSQPDVINTQLVLFALLTVWAYLWFVDDPTWARLGTLCLAFAPAAATDWPAFYLVPVLGLHFVITQPFRQWRWVFAFGVVSIAYFLVLYAPGVAVRGDWAWMGKLVARRTVSDLADSQQRITLGTWVRVALLGHMLRLHSTIAVVLTAAWIGLVGFRGSRGLRDHPATTLVALLLGWAALHVIVGRQGVFVHEWWWWPLTPGVAMASAIVVDWILRGIAQHVKSAAWEWVTNGAMLLGLILFATIYGRPVFAELSQFRGIKPGPDDYSVGELGNAIRTAAPPNQAVVVAEKDNTLPLWFYADRPLMWDVWDVPTLEARQSAGYADSPFDLREPWRAAPVAVVIPKGYLDVTVDLGEHLKSRYRHRDVGKFIVFDLSSPAPATDSSE